MTRRLTKAEKDQRVLEYRIVWLQGYGVGYKKAAEIIPDSGQFASVLWQMTDPKVIKRVQKATRDLYDGSLQPSKKDTEKIGETLGEATHNTWLEMRKAEGWHHPLFCPDKNSNECKTCYHHAEPTPDFPKGRCGHHLKREKGGHCEKHMKRPCPDCHDCMVPYSEVPPDRKKIAQSYPEQFFKIIEEMGYKIIKKE